MTVELQYYVEFGKGDSSDACSWEIELTPAEEQRFYEAIANEEPMEEALPDVLSRAYDEILEQEKENMEDMGEEWSDGYDLVVEFDEVFLESFKE